MRILQSLQVNPLYLYLSMIYLASCYITILVTNQFISISSALEYFYVTRYLTMEYTFCILFLLLTYKVTKKKLLPFLIIYTYIICTIFQTTSYLKSNDYLTKLAISNVKHASILLGVNEILAIALILILMLIPLRLIRMGNSSNKSIIIVSLCFITVFLLPRLDSSFIKFYQDVRNKTQVSKLSPIFELYSLSKSYFTNDVTLESQDIKLNSLMIDDFSLDIERINKPNIIVLFVEGTSARLLNTYGGNIPNLTPNIDKLSKSSIKVTSYFNHTAATYRGIHGQLCSIYPKFGGVGGWGDDKNRESILNSNSYSKCLPKIFTDNGYQTVYFNPHFTNSSYFPQLAEKIGFESIISAEDSSKSFLNNNKGLNVEGLSDKQQLKSIKSYLERRVSSKPLFLSAYTLETHAWVDVTSDGIKYGNGDNHTLNTLHNFDNALGDFLEYIKSSKYSDNTMIVFTTDHAHYFEDSYISLMNSSYKKYFVDEIPLIIHYPKQKTSINFDAKSSTSIDFAPSILQLANIDTKYKFIGQSIFYSSKDKSRLNISAIGTGPEDTFIIVDGEIYRNGFSDKYVDQLDQARKTIKNMRNKEL